MFAGAALQLKRATASLIVGPARLCQRAQLLCAFRGALPSHYRIASGIFIAGDDVSWTPGWVEGAVTTGLNAVWGILKHLGGETPKENPGPGDRFPELAPMALPD